MLSSRAFALSASCDFERAQYRAAVEHFQEGEFLLSVAGFSPLRYTHCEPRLARESWFGYASAAAALGETVLAEQTIERAQHDDATDTRYKILSVTALNHPVPPDLSPQLKERLQKWNSRFDSEEYRESRVKHPGLAAGLSAVLPGLGQAYNGTYQSAAFAFLLNAIFLATTIQFHQQHLDAATVASGLVFSVTYLGNIASAYRGADQMNRSHWQPRELKMRDELFPELNLSPLP